MMGNAKSFLTVDTFAKELEAVVKTRVEKAVRAAADEAFREIQAKLTADFVSRVNLGMFAPLHSPAIELRIVFSGPDVAGAS